MSVAHTHDVAAAIVSVGRHVGLAIEQSGFVEGPGATTLTARELELAPADRAGSWIVRFRAAKRAAAEARALSSGRIPARLEVTGFHGEDFEVDGTLVHTRVDGDYVVAWTAE